MLETKTSKTRINIFREIRENIASKNRMSFIELLETETYFK